MRTCGLFLILLFSLSHCFPQSRHAISSLQLETAAGVTAQECRAVMSLHEGAMYDPQKLVEDSTAILNMLRGRGYLLAVVQTVIADSAASVTVRVTPGPPAMVDSIELSGNRALGMGELRSACLPDGSAQYSDGWLEGAVDRILALYDNAGYPFAAVTVADVRIDTGAAHLRVAPSLLVEEGTLVTIDDIRIAGNATTRPEVIVRASGLRLHDVYNKEAVAKVPARIRRLSLFSDVRPPEVFVEGTTGGLLISVAESNPNSFDGILGYLPATGGDGGGTVTGLLRVTMGNLFGTARRLSVAWQRDDRSSQDIDLAYREPWIFGFPAAASGMFHERQQDSLYVQRTLEAHIDFTLSDGLEVGGLFSHTAVIPSSTIELQPLHASRTVSGGFSGRYDSRDDPAVPTAGVLCQTSYTVGSKRVFGDAPDPAAGTASVRTATMDAEGYRRIFDRQVLFLAAHARSIDGGRLDAGDLFRFGGATTLRGYREKEFAGTRVAWGTVEYRYLFQGRASAFVFLDLGTSYLPAVGTSSSSNIFRAGYGVGTRFDSPLGILGVSLALGKGDSFSEAKLHVAIMNRF